jgi:hypothetical protein
MSRFATTVGVVALGVAIAIAGAGVSIAIAGAAPEPYRVQAVPAAPVNVEQPKPLDLSSVDAINQYLRSRGLDPATFVVQRGPLNYAGPNCPGIVFNCTTATRVVQIATGGTLALSSFSTLNGPTTANDAECVPEEDTTAPLVGVGCVIVQTALVGPEVDQQASCKVESTVPKKQLCDITQENLTGGDNQATISMKIDSKVGTTQLADQEALADQETAGAGNNQFQADQTIVLAARGSPTTQDGYQSVDFQQDVFELSVSALLDEVPASGNNQAQVTQTQNLTAYNTATGGTQEQNAGDAPFADPCRGAVTDANSCVEYDQDTGSGTNQIEVNQRHDLKATSAKSAVTQVQGCDPMVDDKPCGLEEVGSQETDEESTDEGAKNRAAVVQNGTYVLEAPDGTGLVQIQDPHFGGAESEQCCSEDDKFTLDQLAVLRAADNPPPPATPPTLVQSHENFVDDQSTGEVMTKSTIVLNDEQPSVVTCSSGEGDLRRCTYEQHCSNAPPPGTFCPRNGETAVPPETIVTGWD